ncbi:Ig-like domain-containing protein [uncultured Vagococcus sp.]|uniref:Ig-like domain-containing protein n=1 Tax=uncultured Vagococcus sp. TaxID=189676 RepID=UPI0028D64305|nr:Ig-like domain-containing protein [uncultured Vagococcus sp.]
MKKTIIKTMTLSAICLVGSFAQETTTLAASHPLFKVTTEKENISVSSVQLVPEKSLLVGETYQYEAMISPTNASDQSLKWYSQNDKILKVDQNGLVTATGIGTADVYAFASDGDIRGWSEVTVNKGTLPVSSVTLSPKSGIVEVGTPFMIKETILPTATRFQSVTWSSSDSSVATVKNGVVSGIKPGNVTITAVSGDGKKTDTSTLTIKYGSTIPVTSISLPPSKSLLVGETSQYMATVLPAVATDKQVIWQSANEKIVKVDTDGLVTATGVGTADIYALSKDGKSKGWSEVTVKEGNLPVTSVSLSPESGIVEIGSPFKLKETVLPEATKYKVVGWTSSNKAIATVSGGVVTGIKPGIVTITATSIDGKIKGSSTLTVKYGDKIPMTSLSLSTKSKTLSVGQSFQYKSVITPSFATETSLIWFTSDASIASIDDKGLVKGVKKGKTTVFAFSVDGSISDSATLTIK